MPLETPGSCQHDARWPNKRSKAVTTRALAANNDTNAFSNATNIFQRPRVKLSSTSSPNPLVKAPGKSSKKRPWRVSHSWLCASTSSGLTPKSSGLNSHRNHSHAACRMLRLAKTHGGLHATYHQNKVPSTGFMRCTGLDKQIK